MFKVHYICPCCENRVWVSIVAGFLAGSVCFACRGNHGASRSNYCTVRGPRLSRKLEREREEREREEQLRREKEEREKQKKREMEEYKQYVNLTCSDRLLQMKAKEKIKRESKYKWCANHKSGDWETALSKTCHQCGRYPVSNQYCCYYCKKKREEKKYRNSWRGQAASWLYGVSEVVADAAEHAVECAVDKVKDPEFQESVKNTLLKNSNAALKLTKDASDAAIQTIQDPEFQQSVGSKLNYGTDMLKYGGTKALDLTLSGSSMLFKGSSYLYNALSASYDNESKQKEQIPIILSSPILDAPKLPPYLITSQLLWKNYDLEWYYKFANLDAKHMNDISKLALVKVESVDDNVNDNDKDEKHMNNISKLEVEQYLKHPKRGVFYLVDLWRNNNIDAKTFGKLLLNKVGDKIKGIPQAIAVFLAGCLGGMAGNAAGGKAVGDACKYGTKTVAKTIADQTLNDKQIKKLPTTAVKASGNVALEAVEGLAGLAIAKQIPGLNHISILGVALSTIIGFGLGWIIGIFRKGFTDKVKKWFCPEQKSKKELIIAAMLLFGYKLDDFKNEKLFTKKELDKRYHKVCLLLHPDKGGNRSDWDKMTAAHELLKQDIEENENEYKFLLEK